MTITFHSSRHAHADVDDQGVATLTVTDCKTLNILDSTAIVELTDAVQRLAALANVRVLIFRGAGNKAFIGGADIHEMTQLTSETASLFITKLMNLCEAVRRFPGPVIARLSGWCLGGGLEVALACDLRLADDGARFGMPEVAVGIPSVIHAALLPRLIGSSKATWMLMTGEHISAADAFACGLVHELCPMGDLDELVARRARKLAGFGPQVMRQQKQLLRAWQSLPIDEAIASTVDQFSRAYLTGEPQAFMERFLARKPVRHSRPA